MTKSRGGAGPYRKGAAFERAVQVHLEGEGWLVTRQPKSQSPYDLMAYKDNTLWLVQCKLGGKLPKAELTKLLEVTDQFDVVPMLAYKEKGEICLITLP